MCKVQIVLAHYGRAKFLKTAIQLWLLQNVECEVCIVNTDPDKSVRGELDAIADEFGDTVQVQNLMLGNKKQHASWPVAVALDVAAACCTSEYQFHTHNDVFPMSRRVLAHWLSVCAAHCPVVGYEISPRDQFLGWLSTNWKGMVGHTATMLHVPTIDRLGITWKLANGLQLGLTESDSTDTEVPFNMLLRRNGITPKLIGHDRNYERLTDDWIDHVRSYSSSEMYSPEHFERARNAMQDAHEEAVARVSLFRRQIGGVSS